MPAEVFDTSEKEVEAEKAGEDAAQEESEDDIQEMSTSSEKEKKWSRKVLQFQGTKMPTNATGVDLVNKIVNEDDPIERLVPEAAGQVRDLVPSSLTRYVNIDR